MASPTTMRTRSGRLHLTAERSRTALLDTAARMLETMSVAQLELAAVTREAGVSASTVHRHFPASAGITTVERLVETLISERSRLTLDVTQPEIGEQAADYVHRSMTVILQIWRDQTAICAATFQIAASNREFATRYEATLRAWARVYVAVARAHAANRNRTVPEGLLEQAELWLAGSNAYFYRVFRSSRSERSSAEEEAARDVVVATGLSTLGLLD